MCLGSKKGMHENKLNIELPEPNFTLQSTNQGLKETLMKRCDAEIQEVQSEGNLKVENIPIKFSPQEWREIRKQTRKTPKKEPTLDMTFIERFASAWRCKICQKISSNKFIAMDHREDVHSASRQLK